MVVVKKLKLSMNFLDVGIMDVQNVKILKKYTVGVKKV